MSRQDSRYETMKDTDTSVKDYESKLVCNEIPEAELLHIKDTLESNLEKFGFEIAPFKVGWYNEVVARPFQLPLHSDTLAFVVISTPGMFEKAFIPFAAMKKYSFVRDPIDECVATYLSEATKCLPEFSVDIFHDYDLHPNRRPKILVQTAGHLSGAVYFYRQDYLQKNHWNNRKKLCGVCMHPVYGGWFALRAVLVFKNVVVQHMMKKEPLDVLQDEEKCKELLELFNFHWSDNRFRDIIPVKQKYSDLQRIYFNTPPCDRLTLLDSILEGLSQAAQ